MFVHAVRAIVIIHVHALEAFQLQTRAHLITSRFDFGTTFLAHRSSVTGTAVLGSCAYSCNRSLTYCRCCIKLQRVYRTLCRDVGAAAVVGAAPGRLATAVQVSKHTLLVHIVSGIASVHVYAFDTLLLDTLADLLALRWR